MKNFLKSGLVVSIGLVMLSSASVAGSNKVRIFVPTPNPVKQIEKKPVKKDADNVQVIIQRIYHVPYYTREQRLKLFAGPRYPGFNKQYRGPKYPF